MHALVLILLLAGVIGGLLLSVIQVAPAGIPVPAALVVVSFVAGWHVIGIWCWVVQIVCLVVIMLIDNIINMLGLKRLGASHSSQLWGGIGVFVGPIIGGLVLTPEAAPEVGAIIGAPIGAVIGTVGGELSARRAARRASAVAGTPEAEDAASAKLHHLGAAAIFAWAGATVGRIMLVMVQGAAALISLWSI